MRQVRVLLPARSVMRSLAALVVFGAVVGTAPGAAASYRTSAPRCDVSFALSTARVVVEPGTTRSVGVAGQARGPCTWTYKVRARSSERAVTVVAERADGTLTESGAAKAVVRASAGSTAGPMLVDVAVDVEVTPQSGGSKKFFALWLTVQVKPPVPVPPSRSINVVTFNTFLLSEVMACGGPPVLNGQPGCLLDADVEDRAHTIGELIVANADRFDVVALNEVWDNDSKEILESVVMDTPGSPYRWGVTYLDDADAYDPEDSGLMLFSKFPLVELPHLDFEAGDVEARFDGPKTDDAQGKVGFIEFDACEYTFEDCIAAKGAGLVLVQHPGSGQQLAVVFTHLQADSGDDHNHEAREAQLSDITELVETSLDGTWWGNWSNDRWLVVAGDLNIDGFGAVGDALYDAIQTAAGPSNLEWLEQIGDPAKAATTPLYDPWAEASSEKDKGRTYYTSDERLDYILASRAVSKGAPMGRERETCVQHIRIPHEIEGPSDHRPVAAHLNRWAPHCNPRIAVTPKVLGEYGFGVKAQEMMGKVGKKPTVKIQRQIAHPGGVQWFRIDEPGTYAIAAEGPVAYELYAADDMSHALGGGYKLDTTTIESCSGTWGDYLCRPVEAQEWALPTPPFYVKVFGTDASWTGPYAMSIYRYTCSSKAEACELTPNEPQTFTWPAAPQMLNPQDTGWFKVRVTDQADSGQAQTIRLFAKDPAGNTVPDMKLQTSSGGSVLLDGSAPTEQTSQDQRSFTGTTATNTTMYMLVTRPAPASSATFARKVGWGTNLTLLGGTAVGAEPARLVCEDETDPEAGEDEIYFHAIVDGTDKQLGPETGFDCNNMQSQVDWEDELGVIRFLHDVGVYVNECDGSGESDCGDPSSTFTVTGYDEFTPLPPDDQRRVKPQMVFDTGNYRLDANLGKRLAH